VSPCPWTCHDLEQDIELQMYFDHSHLTSLFFIFYFYLTFFCAIDGCDTSYGHHVMMFSGFVVIEDYCSYGWRAEQRDMAYMTDPPIFSRVQPTQVDITSLGYWCECPLTDSALRKKNMLCGIWVKCNNGFLRLHFYRVMSPKSLRRDWLYIQAQGYSLSWVVFGRRRSVDSCSSGKLDAVKLSHLETLWTSLSGCLIECDRPQSVWHDC